MPATSVLLLRRSDMRFRAAIAIFLAFFLLPMSGCKKQSTIYFVPIGDDAPTQEINDLVSHYRQKFGLEIHVLPLMALDATDTDPDRKQLIAENLIESMQEANTAYALDKSAILIGITKQDIYPRSMNWQFCFGWRQDARSAVVSTARMNLHIPASLPVRQHGPNDLQKVVTKDIGLMYYGKSPSDNPKSVLYNRILGIQELDQASEDFGQIAGFSIKMGSVFAAGMQPTTTLDLLGRARQGSEDALSLLFERYRRRLAVLKCNLREHIKNFTNQLQFGAIRDAVLLGKEISHV